MGMFVGNKDYPDYVQCSDCGEIYYALGGPHACDDLLAKVTRLADRCVSLEKKLEDLSARLANAEALQVQRGESSP